MGSGAKIRRITRKFISRWFLIAIFGGFPAVVIMAIPGGAIADTCRQDTVYLRGDWGQARFSVDVADTEATRARGLMSRADLPTSSGMLFVYPTPREVGFWMKNTLIPLDMIFVGVDGVVRLVHHNAVPHDRTVIPGGDGVLAVLEINGGLARAMGISPGSEMRHPAFGEYANWACE